MASIGLAALVVLVITGAALANGPMRDAPVVMAPTPEPTQTAIAQRDSDVAFWEERLARGGGYETILRLADALIERSRATGDLSDLQRAAAALDEIATAPPDDAGLALRRGRIAFSLHDFATARAEAAAALAADPHDPAALALAGDAALEMGDVAAADEAYAALAEAGRRPPILSRLARRAWLSGDTEAAEALVAEAIRTARLADRGDELAFYDYQLAEMLRARHAIAEAEVAYQAALAAQPDHVPSMGGLALVLAASGDTHAAIGLLETATARLPAPDLVAALGDLYAIVGRDDDAEDRWALVERIAELGRANGGVHDRQLVLFLADHDRDPERAVELAAAEIELRADVYGHDALAWTLFKAGRLDEADASAARALSLGTPDGRIHFHAGLIAEALGRADDAREHLAIALERRAALPPGQWEALDAALERLDQ